MDRIFAFCKKKKKKRACASPQHSGRHYPRLFCNHWRYFAFYCIMSYCASRNNLEMLIPATICQYFHCMFYLTASVCRIQRLAIKNTSSNHAASHEAGSPSQREKKKAHPSVTLREDNTSPLNKICSPWHIPCWTIHLSLLPFHHAAIYCESGGALCYVCLNRWRNWQRKVIHLWSHSRVEGVIALRAL